MTLTTCLICRKPTRNGSRCERCAISPRGHAHASARAQTLAEEFTCAVCGKPGTPSDPLVGGHIHARALGGPDTRANMRAEHASCNAKRGVDAVEWGHRGSPKTPSATP
jgi:5-methylcytosine-specific restriction endonuclease McrA